jgi:Raf kinase inhibitor-like YbhB/YbcL family protein
MGNLKLTSSAFSDGNPIPRECGYKNGNKEPPLAISGIPAEAKSLTLIMDDPDAMEVVGKVWVHWVVWNIIPDQDMHPDDDITPLYDSKITADVKCGMTDFDDTGYGGPAPPDKRHTYVFKLYALDSMLDLPISSTKADVEKAMEGHIIEQVQLTGTYAP